MIIPEYIVEIMCDKEAMHDRVYHWIGKGYTNTEAYERMIQEVQSFAPLFRPYSSAESYRVARNKAYSRKESKQSFNT